MTALSTGRRLQRGRPAFTLVELLVVIVIITILAATALFTLYGVREDARESRARAMVTKINERIMERWESYRTRALPIRIPAGTDPRPAAAIRLNAVRELMRMELPDRITDLASPPMVLTTAPATWLAYQRRIAANTARGNTWTTAHEHAECLYMILAGMREGDSTGLEGFSESEIGDVDNDGMPEILDPWGRPIYFLRWAPGYVSVLQPANPLDRQPDPFDPLRVDPRWENNDDGNANTRLDDPFALYPLIYSAGRDGRYGVVRTDYDDATVPPTDIAVSYAQTATDPYRLATLNPALYPYASDFPAPPWSSGMSLSGIWLSRPLNDPYMILPKSGDYVGRRFVTNNDADDDITNHLLEMR